MSDNSNIKFTILGSGTSSGVPTIGCQCPTCTSTDLKDKRLRTSLLIQSKTTTLVVDTTPDFRQQMLKYDVREINGLLYTHSHFDHIGGFDDIRAFNYILRKPIPIYLNEITLSKIKRAFFYAFEEPEQFGGGVPVVDINLIDYTPFTIGDIEIVPIEMYHGKLDVMGFRIGKFAYCTDTNYIPENSLKKLEDLDILVIDALRYKPHPTHFNVDEALRIVDILKPKMAYFIHIAHQIKHAECEKELPENVRIAYDGLVLNQNNY